MNKPDPFHRPELLAPGGDLQALQVAVHNGADAVYFGLDRFSARSQARNLTLEQLPEAMRFLHEHSARGYLALNTLMRNDELAAAVDLAIEACKAGIDAVIVQDIGLATLLHRTLPELVLHGSTQMSLFSQTDLALARDLGLSRLVLPRELSGDELRELTILAAEQQIETEAFIHGALCICYSGQCLMSSLIGGRSGNRGACAQPCRLDYRLGQQEGALYSPRDQSLLAHLPVIVQTPLTSLKIEGRMRSAAYVGQVVATYRQALDRLESLFQAGKSADEIEKSWPQLIEGDFLHLLQAFNRGGSFTSTYWQGNQFDNLTVHGIPGSHGIRIGAVTRLDPFNGALWIDGSAVLNPGDVLAVRRPQAEGQDQAVASAPVGNSHNDQQGLQIKGFHPDVLRELRIGDDVYRMSDAMAEQAALRADSRKTMINLVLDESSLSAVVRDGIFAGRMVKVEYVPDPALKPLMIERAEQQLRKTGGTAYRVDKVSITGEIMMTISQLNQLRRDLMALLGDVLAGSRAFLATPPVAPVTNPALRLSEVEPIDAEPARFSVEPENAKTPEISAFFHQLPQDEADILCGADIYELPLLALDEKRIQTIVNLIRTAEPQARIVVHWPPLVTGSKSAILPDLINQAGNWPIDGVCTAWPAYWDRNRQNTPVEAVQGKIRPDPVRIADTTANLFNSQSLLTALSAGADTICPSLELNGEQLRDVLQQLQKDQIHLKATIERTLYGRLRLMSTAYCPVGKNVPSCRICVRSAAPDDSRVYQLTDRRSQNFPVLPHPRTCQADLLNSDLLAVPEEVQQLKASLPTNFNWRSRLYFCDETTTERQHLVHLSRQLLNAAPSGQDHAAEALLNEARAIATRLNCRLTTGHFQRGVQ